MNKRATAVTFIASIALCAGCGGAAGQTSRIARTGTSSAQVPGVDALRGAIRTALRGNEQVSLYVLWHNRIPVWATQSTRGPALASLRSAAVTRKQQGIQIKNLTGGYAILEITLNSSYATATVIVRDRGTVAPYEHGHREGRAIAVNDRARFDLHRLGSAARFVVWSVTPIQ